MMDKKRKKVEQYIEQYQMIGRGDRIVTGVSGGADSVCLLFVLCELRKKLGFEVIVCHVNHQLRAEAAEQDEAYVKELCRKLDVAQKASQKVAGDFLFVRKTWQN